MIVTRKESSSAVRVDRAYYSDLNIALARLVVNYILLSVRLSLGCHSQARMFCGSSLGPHGEPAAS